MSHCPFVQWRYVLIIFNFPFLKNMDTLDVWRMWYHSKSSQRHTFKINELTSTLNICIQQANAMNFCSRSHEPCPNAPLRNLMICNFGPDVSRALLRVYIIQIWVPSVSNNVTMYVLNIYKNRIKILIYRWLINCFKKSGDNYLATTFVILKTGE